MQGESSVLAVQELTEHPWGYKLRSPILLRLKGNTDNEDCDSLLLVLTVIGTTGARDAHAECVIADAKLEEAILKKPEFRDPKNRQMVRDLRRLRDSALILWSYGKQTLASSFLAISANLLRRLPWVAWAEAMKTRSNNRLQPVNLWCSRVARFSAIAECKVQHL